MKKVTIITLVLFFVTIVICYSQYLKKGVASAVLQHQIDLSNPPVSVFAISTSDQKFSDGKILPKGTKFIGNVGKGADGFIIYFNTIQTPEGKREQINAKSNLKVSESQSKGGVSAKIGKTLYKQNKSNVLGAIFTNPSAANNLSGLMLPRGSIVKIEFN